MTTRVVCVIGMLLMLCGALIGGVRERQKLERDSRQSQAEMVYQHAVPALAAALKEETQP